MKHVWLIINTTSQQVLAVYSEKDLAEKMSPAIAKKMKAIVRVEKRSVDQEIGLIGVKP